MGEFLDRVPAHLREHVAKIAAGSGLEPGGETTELIARAWLEKEAAFAQRIGESGMEEWDSFPADEKRGALVLTYSGSLLTIGPLDGGKREVEYASVGLRQDVPAFARSEASALKGDLAVDQVAAFSGGPIEKSSAVFKIAVAKEKLDPEAEKEMLGEVTQVLAEDFVEVNKTVARP